MFRESDLQYVEKIGLNKQKVMQQVEILQRGNLFVNITAPATAGKGIKVFDAKEIQQMLEGYDALIKGKKLLKFIPASGAATRMFKDVFTFMEKYKTGIYQDDPSLKEGFLLMNRLPQIAFYPALKRSMSQQGMDLDDCLARKDYVKVVKHILFEEGLNYAALPKGLLLFHTYGNEQRTAFEEHLVEGAAYTKNSDGKVYLHFTVSPEHHALFDNLFRQVHKKYENKYKVNYDISFSYQSTATHTIALDENKQLFRNEDGSLEFRPGGHGSLLNNLSQLDADIVFIKNIDNVTYDDLKADTFLYKKLLCATLLNLQNRCFEYLKTLESSAISEKDLHLMELYIKDNLNIQLPVRYSSFSTLEKQAYLFNILNRPMRVCGMVKRENEPGGGPFWLQNEKGELSLQIVETSEIDNNNPEQWKHVEHSEYFNPVDLVCSLKNFKGESFDLSQYTDEKRYFISDKSKNGKTLKALEHPGLWNGAMSDWITVFVAVPLSTFTPVKTVNDLLRKEHVR